MKQLFAFGAGVNPFPGAVAGVYGPVADADAAVATLSGQNLFSVAFDSDGALYYANGSGATRIMTPAVDTADKLPQPVSGETFASLLIAFSTTYDTLWSWEFSGSGLTWTRIKTSNISSPSSLPSPEVSEDFCFGLSCVSSSGEQWLWDSSELTWVRTVTPDVLNYASLPVEQSGEKFADGTNYFGSTLYCTDLDTGVVYQWTGTSWDATP